ncbi:MAG: GAF domain-containing protein [Deltaproteobacteria bacterium]|nr:GAF domain-containing protein [Deltaproteobacteria bacterium]
MSRNKDYFNAFINVSKAFGTARNKEDILKLIVESAIETMAGKAACLYLADQKKDVFVPVAQKGLSDRYLHASPIQSKKIVKAILKGGFLAFTDATTDPRLEHHEEKKAEGIASILTVPVMVSNRTIGILSLYTAQERKFTKDEIKFLSALAEHGGMAIERARLLDRIYKNAQVFLNLTNNINASLDIKKILHILTEDIARALDLKGVTIRLYNREKDTLDLVSSYGLSEAFLHRGPVDAHEGMQFIEDSKTVVIEDVNTDERIKYKKEALKEGITSMLWVPILSGDKVIGVMRLYSSVQMEVSEEMLMMVNALARQGGLAIQNASMYLALQNDKKSLEEDIWSHRMWF